MQYQYRMQSSLYATSNNSKDLTAWTETGAMMSSESLHCGLKAGRTELHVSG